MASEIAALDLSGTSLVCLSACDTGQGQVTPEGVYGLQRAFRKSGVRYILMNLWESGDRLNGWDPTYGCLYYYNPKTATIKWMLSKSVHLRIG